MYRSGNRKTAAAALFLFVLLVFQHHPVSAAGDSLDVFPGGWDTYPSHFQYLQTMDDLAENYPGICRLDTIGQSVDGRPILAMKITDQPDVREPEPVFYYTSTIHGDETSGFMLLLRLTDYLVRNYGQDELTTRLVDNIEIWINPLANPDGTYGSSDSAVSNPQRWNANGVDLNRNFPGLTGGIVDYEPETLGQMHFMQDIHPLLSANIHDGSEVFNYPWDTWERLHADDAWYIWAGRKYVDTVQARAIPLQYMSDQNNGITNGYQWYSIDGGRQDYVNYYLHGREVTLELSREKNPSPDFLPYLWYYNYPALLQYMENCLFGIQGRVTDAVTGLPLKARIEVAGHDMDESHVFSDSISGYFARLIEAGSWSLEITAEGYENKTVPDVAVEWDEATGLQVQMEPLPEGYEQPGHVLIYPNPWVRDAQVVFRVNVPGMHSIILTGMDGRVVRRDRFPCPDRGTFTYRMDGDGIAPGWYVLRVISPEGILSAKILRWDWK